MATNTASLANYMAAPSQPAPYTTQPTPDQTVQNSLQSMLNPNSQYIQDARQEGMNFAAQRGGLNSSIAAGASERAAIQAAQPFVQDSLDMQKTRDVLARQNWLNAQGFNRDFQGKIAMMPITNAYQSMQHLQDMSLLDPSLYTPDVISGYSQFFNKNMNDVTSQYLGKSTAPTPPAPTVPGSG